MQVSNETVAHTHPFTPPHRSSFTNGGPVQERGKSCSGTEGAWSSSRTGRQGVERSMLRWEHPLSGARHAEGETVDWLSRRSQVI